MLEREGLYLLSYFFPLKVLCHQLIVLVRYISQNSFNHAFDGSVVLPIEGNSATMRKSYGELRQTRHIHEKRTLKWCPKIV